MKHLLFRISDLPKSVLIRSTVSEHKGSLCTLVFQTNPVPELTVWVNDRTGSVPLAVLPLT